MIGQLMFIFFFFFNDTATTEIYTLSLHDALPICHFLATVANGDGGEFAHYVAGPAGRWTQVTRFADRVTRAALGADGFLYLVSLQGTPRGKVLRVSLERPELAAAEVVATQDSAAIQGIVV